MGTSKPNPSPTPPAEQLVLSNNNTLDSCNRALATLLKELNVTIWSLDKTQFFRMQPILEDIRNMSRFLNWRFAMDRCKLNRHTLHRALERESQIQVQTFVRMLHGMGLRIRVEPDPSLPVVIAPQLRKRWEQHWEHGNPRYRNSKWRKDQAALQKP